ncbi:MAG TPA: ferredoxin [bacterium]|nr:ferredoxin [bacterium]
MSIKVDQNKCIGCGMCVNMCPKVFKMNSMGKSEVISQQDVDCARNAANSCPVEAIKVE